MTAVNDSLIRTHSPVGLNLEDTCATLTFCFVCLFFFSFVWKCGKTWGYLASSMIMETNLLGRKVFKLFKKVISRALEA